MADEDKKAKAPFLGEDKDDALMEDLNLDGVEGLEGIQVESGRPLPKKVELDIDDLLLEEEEAEEPPPPVEAPAAAEEPAPEAVPEEAAEEPKARLSPLKLALLIGSVVVPLLAVVVLFVFIGGKEPGPAPPKPAVDGPARVDLLPFVINFPTEDKEIIIELEMAVYFSNKQAQREFEQQTLVLRDLIFRFVQGHEPSKLAEPEAKEELARELGELIDSHLELGQVRRVQVSKLGVV